MKDFNTGYDAENHDPHIETRMEGDTPTAGASYSSDYWKKRCEAAEAYIKKYSQKLPDGPEFMDWQNTIEPEPEGSYREGWVSVEKFREMAEALDKPVLNMLKKQNIGFDKWSENIHRLVEKELGFRKISVYEPLPQPPKTDK